MAEPAEDYNFCTTVCVEPLIGGQEEEEDNVISSCATSSSSRRHFHARVFYHPNPQYSHYESSGEVESTTICLKEFEESERALRNHIRDEIEETGWPVDDATNTPDDIVENVIEKLKQFGCDLRVDLRTVRYAFNDDWHIVIQDNENGNMGSNESSSLKRKRIELDDVDGDRCCVICLAELKVGSEVAVMPSCNHCSFHHDCLSTWLDKSPSCPLCRCMILRLS